MIENPETRVVDASTAYRTDPAWTYGFPEMDRAQGEKVRAAKRVSNPGCYPTGALLPAAFVVLPEIGVFTHFCSGLSAMFPFWEASAASLNEILAVLVGGISWLMWFFTAGSRA